MEKWDRRAGGETLDIAQHEQDPVFQAFTERGWGQRAGLGIKRPGFSKECKHIFPFSSLWSSLGKGSRLTVSPSPEDQVRQVHSKPSPVCPSPCLSLEQGGTLALAVLQPYDTFPSLLFFQCLTS